jgi:hypothetical protein
MTEKNKPAAEQAVRALYDFLTLYFNRNRIPWMHGLSQTEFDQGYAYALTGLALIPELRKAIDDIDEQVAGNIGSSLEEFHEVFKPKENQ